MKTIITLVYIAALCSCKKNDPAPAPNPAPAPAPRPDTLGTGWKKITVDSTVFFSDIVFSNNTTGFAVGDKSFKSVDGGLSWTPVSAPPSLQNIAITGDNKIFFTGNAGYIYKSVDGGATLTTAFIPNTAGFDIFFTDNNNGFYTTTQGLYQTTDGGVSWTLVPTTGLNFTVPGYSSCFFTSVSSGVFVSPNGVFRTNGSVNNWQAATFASTPSTNAFQSVFITPNKTIFVCSANRELFKSVDNGVSYSLVKVFPATTSLFADIHFTDDVTGYVCSGNRIYKTTDAGNTWNVVVALGESQLIELHFTDAGHGWACGKNGTVLYYK